MTCTEFIALLDDIIDDSIAAETKAEVEKHMHKCGHCEVVLQHHPQDHLKSTAPTKSTNLPNDLRDRLHAAIMARCKKGC